jgi:hypothetical protein
MFRHAFGRQVFIRPIIEERSVEMEEFGWRSGSSDRLVRFRPYILTSFIRWGAQSDMLMWLMSEAKGVEGHLKAGPDDCSTLQLLRL